jgi:hypothetical protein
MTRIGFLLVLFFLSFSIAVFADSITITGNITQPNANPPAGNSGLDNIQAGDAYTVNLDFTGGLTAAGTYSLSGGDFSDPTVGASETFFGGSFTSFADGSFTVQVCLSSCNSGNELDLNFMIPFASRNSQNVAANSVPNQTPFDLLEDDGLTDIQGSVSGYTYNAAAASVPEPSSLLLLGPGLAGLAIKRFRRSPMIASCKQKSWVGISQCSALPSQSHIEQA